MSGWYHNRGKIKREIKALCCPVETNFFILMCHVRGQPLHHDEMTGQNRKSPPTFSTPFSNHGCPAPHEFSTDIRRNKCLQYQHNIVPTHTINSRKNKRGLTRLPFKCISIHQRQARRESHYSPSGAYHLLVVCWRVPLRPRRGIPVRLAPLEALGRQLVRR